jgi:bisphosphoglycerate-dependent phosphoglycerate mutase
MLLYIIRHGDPNYELDCLTERGKLQAEAVGKRMLDAKIDRIFTSPMGRAIETAKPACELLGIDYKIEEWTHEVGDERLTPFPSGKMKSISFIQNSKLRENGNQELTYNEAFTCPGIRESHMDEAIKYIESNGKDFLE